MFRRLDVWPSNRPNKPTGPQAPTPQRPIGANDRNGVGAYCIRPPDGPERGRMIIPGDVFPPRTGAPGGAYAIRPYTGTIIRAIGPPRDTVIRARGARLVGRMQYAPTRVPTSTNQRASGSNISTIQRGVCGRRRSWPGIRRGARPFLRVRICHFGPPLRYDHIAIFPLISFSTPPKSTLSLWQIFT